jgi:hypothetical protein
MILNKFKLQNSIHSHIYGKRIYIKAESIDLFILLVKPHFHHSMLYKLL